ncbi:hypothetical protein VSH64_15895 [Amycolatopsis rhabdoformis]|uniref:Uncharacterized protein n=1 Tax=Amycolatopsis rhabdoformis TaxID=1448059 RepID=A0ABZ1IGH2_9PSEU|nr:hypothetical protein [Amycolatopsis rhabdoformis]WSE33570.1 hypothetical protein VSH64_15895 [Amycolatopsis rhabdoformis]
MADDGKKQAAAEARAVDYAVGRHLAYLEREADGEGVAIRTGVVVASCVDSAEPGNAWVPLADAESPANAPTRLVAVADLIGELTDPGVPRHLAEGRPVRPPQLFRTGRHRRD